MQLMLLSSAYLPPVWYFTKLFLCDGKEVQIEQWDHYMKQTYRNRCVIGGADGLLTLTVPTEKADSPKSYMRDVRISEHGNWRHQHWNALEAAYGQTPFFLYYEDDFRPFYERRFEFLFDFNLQLTTLCCRLIDIRPVLCPTEEYSASNHPAPAFRPQSSPSDFRELIHPRHDPTCDPTFRPAPYYQVFAGRFGFRPNLSIVDLLFNMGPESLLILQQSIFAPKA
ncbi:MAG: WbqC family protein [Bacteroidaceae bacterium]|nr:WbqC family protein [Bacteroidaceae bacterium]